MKLEKVLLYCAGDYCRNHFKIFSSLYDVVAVIDRNIKYSKTYIMDKPIYGPDMINQLVFERIIIASDREDIILSAKETIKESGYGGVVGCAKDAIVSELILKNYSNCEKNEYTDKLGNKIYIGCNCTIKYLQLYILGGWNSVHIDNEVIIKERLNGYIGGKGNHLYIGERTTIVSCYVDIAEGGNVSIGKDCMLSAEIEFYQNATHPFFDLYTEKRINTVKNINIGNHVWIGKKCGLMAGFQMGNNSIVGYGTVSSAMFGDNLIVAGNPGRVIRTDIDWTRDAIGFYNLNSISDSLF